LGWFHIVKSKGIVVDEFGNAIDYAYIVNTTSETHAHTNELGLFSIDKSIVGNILKVTALGHKKANYTIVAQKIEFCWKRISLD
jgi:hypothetical protein